MKPRMQGLQVCEFIGSFFLVVAAIAPMVLLYHVLQVDLAVAIIGDALAVGFVLFALIEVFGPICTAYFNPAVCLAMVLSKDLSWKRAAVLTVNQIAGGFLGMLAVHLMFYQDIPTLLTVSTVSRSGGVYLAEVLGTFLLVLTILSLVHQRSTRVSLVVGLLVGGMLLSTSSTMFANPQVTIARVFTYSVAGVAPVDAVVFIVMQVLGAALAVVAWRQVRFRCETRPGTSRES